VDVGRVIGQRGNNKWMEMKVHERKRVEEGRKMKKKKKRKKRKRKK